MAFPTVADADTQTGTVVANSSSWTLTYPTNIAAGDLLLAFVAADGTAGTNSWPSGWVFASLGSGANTLDRSKKLADGTETGTFSVGFGAAEQGGWIVYRIAAGTWEGTLGTIFSNLNGAADGSVVASFTPTGSPSANPDPPSLNPANWGTEDTLWFAVASADTSRTFSAFPSTFTNTGSQVSGGAGGASLGYCRLESAVSSVDPGTFTISASDDWVAGTVAVRPAAAATDPMPRRPRAILQAVNRSASY